MRKSANRQVIELLHICDWKIEGENYWLNGNLRSIDVGRKALKSNFLKVQEEGVELKSEHMGILDKMRKCMWLLDVWLLEKRKLLFKN